MSFLRIEEPVVETDDTSAVRSHQSYDLQVYAVCHHSGRYLTRDETNPMRIFFLHEQHDFPGLPKLDRSFAGAAHSREHQHLFWSLSGIQSLAIAISGSLLLVMVFIVFRYQDFVSAGIQYTLFHAALGVITLAGIVLLLWAGFLSLQREQLFHKKANGLPPAVSDFPVQCTYEINAHEELRVQLGNALEQPPNTSQQEGKLTVTVRLTENDLESYQEYREQYRDHSVGEYVHAGVVALENLQGIDSLDGAVEFDHRIVLRKRTTEVSIAEDGRGVPSFTTSASYRIRRSVLCSSNHGDERFLLECQPRLSPFNSRELELRFLWRNQDANTTCKLEDCILDVPDELERATWVDRGRYSFDGAKGQVIWRNLTFRREKLSQCLVLRVLFEHPVLKYQEMINGVFVISSNGLVSNMHLSPDRIWTAWGLKAKSEASIIRRKTRIEGSLIIDPRRLSQEHEYVRSISLSCNAAPDYQLVNAVLRVLLEDSVDLLRISEAEPRINPAGRLDAHLRYWDIAGRRYNADSLDSFDVHVVVSGHDRVALSSSAKFPAPQTKIDLYVRCLHDPRNTSVPEAVDKFLLHVDLYGHDLEQRIQNAITNLQRAT